MSTESKTQWEVWVREHRKVIAIALDEASEELHHRWKMGFWDESHPDGESDYDDLARRLELARNTLRVLCDNALDEAGAQLQADRIDAGLTPEVEPHD